MPNQTDGKGILHISNTYNLLLQADLLVLSCCENGIGRMVTAEGIMALN